MADADTRRESDGADDGCVHVRDVPVEVIADGNDNGSDEAAEARARNV